MHAVFIAGYAGTGKTTAARLLAPRIEAVMLDKDSMTRPLVDVLCAHLTGDADDRQSQTYRDVVRPAEYACITRTARDAVASGASVVVSAPLLDEITDPSWVADMRTEVRAADPDGEVWVVWVSSDAETLHRRIRERAASRDRGKLAAWDEYAATMTLDDPPGADFVLDNSGDAEPLERQVRRVANRILTALPPSDAEPI